ncbi:DUF300 domain-containing protein [Colletotrichum kahawae]|uniref:DUF300 domain-containing protein n=1 Tax=Colletotrichum kahawae TaxID=34407 RepID=A0AAE0D4Z1_COLKA|nr:DUF300 domain-containing protein [Colletotrichum kahawae]
MAKPLMSPLLLENVSTPAKQASQVCKGLSDGKASEKWAADASAVPWSTPKKRDELQDQFSLFSKLDNDEHTQRLLFRKVQKGFDEQAYQLAVAQRKIEALQAEVDASRARKRKKVRISPNSKFADIEAIRRAQTEAGELENSTDESSESENPRWRNVGGGEKWVTDVIFQYPVVSLLIAILTAITQAAGVYCEFASKAHFAKLWLSIIASVSLTIAIMTVIRFYMQLRGHLAHHQPLAKVLAFKLVVSLTFLENIIFWILRDVGALNPTAMLTWADLNIGIPSMLICIEMFPLAIFFHYAYSHRPYIIGGGHTRRPVAGDLEAYEP